MSLADFVDELHSISEQDIPSDTESDEEQQQPRKKSVNELISLIQELQLSVQECDAPVGLNCEFLETLRHFEKMYAPFCKNKKIKKKKPTLSFIRNKSLK